MAWRIVVNVARDAGRAAVRRQRLWERLVQLRSGWTGNDDIPLGISNDRLLEAIRELRLTRARYSRCASALISTTRVFRPRWVSHRVPPESPRTGH